MSIHVSIQGSKGELCFKHAVQAVIADPEEHISISASETDPSDSCAGFSMCGVCDKEWKDRQVDPEDKTEEDEL